MRALRGHELRHCLTHVMVFLLTGLGGRAPLRVLCEGPVSLTVSGAGAASALSTAVSSALGIVPETRHRLVGGRPS